MIEFCAANIDTQSGPELVAALPARIEFRKVAFKPHPIPPPLQALFFVMVELLMVTVGDEPTPEVAVPIPPPL